MDIIGYIINGSCELYRSLRKPTVYTTSDVMTMRGAELIGKIFHGKRLLNFDLTYGRISDVVGLYSEIFLYKCYDFVCDNEAPFIIDGGANIGMATLRFKTLYPKAEIIAFEPQPDVCERLRANIKANGLNGVQVVEKAVCDTEGELILNRTIDGVTDCCASLDVTPNMNDQITVKTTSLLPYITRRVDCLKLDIEGSEYPALKALADADRLRLVDRIILEYHPIRRHGVTNGYFKPLIDLLSENGYYVDIRPPHELDGEMASCMYMDGFAFYIIYASRRPEDIKLMGAFSHYKEA